MRLVIAICVAAFVSLPFIESVPKTAGLIMALTIGGAMMINLVEFIFKGLRNAQESREHKAFMKRMDAERKEREAKDPEIYTRMDMASAPF